MKISGKIGRKVDIWSLGITMHEMAYTGRPPMFELEHFQYMFKLCTTKTPPATPLFIHEKLQDVMNMCLVYDSQLRGTAQDILNYIN